MGKSKQVFKKSVAVIGAGVSGLSAACYLSAASYQVQVFEKNSTSGGRARQLKANGYTFDMGPSWYWMPDVFESFFNDFDYRATDFYTLTLLDPSFDVVFKSGESTAIPAALDQLYDLFERFEKGSAAKLKKYLEEARFKYQAGMEKMVLMPGLSLTEFIDRKVISGALRLQVFTSLSRHVRKYFSDPRLIALMEFPVLFLGAMPQQTPALYSLMNHAALVLGTWYPQGGFAKVTESMEQIARANGVEFHFNAPVQRILTEDNKVYGVQVNGAEYKCDAVIAAADYHHVESALLPENLRNYTEQYWNKKTFAPSCLIFYIGLSRNIESLQHHTLFFDEQLLQHSVEIYKDPKWPTKPLFYVCCPSKTDETVAPPGHENLFVLMPIAVGLEDSAMLREKYFNLLMDRLEKHLGQQLRPHIDYKSSYCVEDFVSDYNAFKGNAYGLANTLRQTAILKPKIRNRQLKNLFYSGQLTVPGPGVPPAIISGKLAAQQVQKLFKKSAYEVVV